MNSFTDHFDFIFHNKKDEIRLTKLSYVMKRLRVVEANFCLDYYDQNDNKIIKYFRRVSNLVEGSFSINDFDKLTEAKNNIKEITQPLLKKKSELLNTLLLHYHRLNRKHPSLYSLRFSFSLKRDAIINKGFDNPLEVKNSCWVLVSAMRNFLNNARQRVLLQKIVGHFWVVMKEPNGMPYIHINFYINDDRFNANLATEIINLWAKVTSNDGCALFFDVSRRYGNSEVYNDKVRTMFSRKLVDDKSKAEDIFLDDFNQKGNSQLKYDALASDIKSFEAYLILLAKESYPVHTLNAISKNEIRNKDMPLIRFYPPYDPIKAKKVRSYAISQIKK
ncbi:hypothetical protein [Rahnella sp. CJA17(1/100)]|uniref:hypothetical protein n=1 Tax=Rahnella sp. CJA17(1/100) TaxID=2508951 RepID=UPI00106FA78E|nr:hypothetical protein [Rahnella sp. CJA17(1/100)]